MSVTARWAFAGVLVLAAIPAARAAAQEKPNFSGTWVADGQGGTGQPTAAMGQKVTIQHDGEAFTIVRQVGTGLVAMAHTLNGSETRTRMPARLCEGDGVSVHTAVWDGTAIRITLVGSVPPGAKTPIKRESTWTIRQESADALTIQLVNPTGPNTPPRTTTTSYRRSSDAPLSVPPMAVKRAPATIGQLAWLSGVWVGSIGSNTAEERWTPAAGGSMLAISRTLRNDLMVAFEFLCIVEREGSLVYTAMPNGRQPATDFTLTAITPDSATFENPAHDFPKKIQYSRKPDGSLEAVVSGDPGQKPQTFVFRRQE